MSEDYSAFGYNTDYQTSYNPTPMGGTTRDDWFRAIGKDHRVGSSLWGSEKNQYDEWVQSQKDQYQAYINWYNSAHSEWYNSEAQELARKTAIGQNPFYNADLGSPMSPSAPSSFGGGTGSPYDPNDVSSILTSMANQQKDLATMYMQFQNMDADRELTYQRAIGKALDNTQQGYMLGVNPKELIKGVGPEELSVLDGSKFSQNVDASIASLRASGTYKQYQADNILPKINELYKSQVALYGLSEEERKTVEETIRPKMLAAMTSQFENSPKKMLADWKKEIDDIDPKYLSEKGKGIAKELLNVAWLIWMPQNDIKFPSLK